MSIQDEFSAAAQAYAIQLEKQQEAERLAALTLEARTQSNASAFAAFLEDRLAQHDTDTTDQEN